MRRPPRIAGLLAVAVLATGAPAVAGIDVPVPGRVVSVVARTGDRRALVFRSVIAPGIVAPLPDPTVGASLVVFASNGAGQCRAEIVLPAVGWAPIRGDGPGRGWRYRDPTGAAQGVQAVTVALRRGGGGRVVVKAKGPTFPCGLEAVQAVPFQVAVRIADRRYCAAFDAGSVRANRPGRFRATAAAPPAACPDTDVTVANLNVLHGFACGPPGYCRLADRVALLGAWVVGRGCPDVVTLQEVANVIPGMMTLLDDTLRDLCPTPYARVYVTTGIGVDDQMILSRYPVLASGVVDLWGPLRTVTHARVDHPVGAIDVFSTHLASGADAATSPCGVYGPCPPACIAAGAATVRECQAVETALAVEALHDGPGPALLTGDLNAPPDGFVTGQFTVRGWIDTYRDAGNPECAPATGVGCTSGRVDDALTELESPAPNTSARIDYVFLVPPTPGSSCQATIDSPADGDGDGIATRLFADAPNPFEPPCGAAPAPICWPSDHTGVQADVNCE